MLTTLGIRISKIVASGLLLVEVSFEDQCAVIYQFAHFRNFAMKKPVL